jgi:hypothetical protein
MISCSSRALNFPVDLLVSVFTCPRTGLGFFLLVLDFVGAPASFLHQCSCSGARVPGCFPLSFEAAQPVVGFRVGAAWILGSLCRSPGRGLVSFFFPLAVFVLRQGLAPGPSSSIHSPARDFARPAVSISAEASSPSLLLFDFSRCRLGIVVEAEDFPFRLMVRPAFGLSLPGSILVAPSASPRAPKQLSFLVSESFSAANNFKPWCLSSCIFLIY